MKGNPEARTTLLAQKLATGAHSSHERIVAEIVGASESLSVFARTFAGSPIHYKISEYTAIADSRLDLRCILGDSATMDDHPLMWAEGYASAIDQLQQFGWDVRRTDALQNHNYVIVDHNVALLTQMPDDDSAGPAEHFFITDKNVVATLDSQFADLWHTAEAGADYLLEWQDLVAPSHAESTKLVIEASIDRWRELIRYFASNPDEIRQLPSRKFEELVAQLLEKDGMDVELTPPKKDGGFDILAKTNTALGPHLFLVECKRYNEGNKVGVEWVRQLYGIVEEQKANAGMIVTTSAFTRGAQEFRKRLEYRMSLNDFDGLKQWLRRIEKRKT